MIFLSSWKSIIFVESTIDDNSTWKNEYYHDVRTWRIGIIYKNLGSGYVDTYNLNMQNVL